MMSRLIILYIALLVLKVSHAQQQGYIAAIPCPDGYVQIYDRCYYFSVEPDTFEGSEFDCRERKGHLAVINKRKQQLALKKYLERQYVAHVPRWLGGQYNWKKKQWVWRLTGRIVKFHSFTGDRNNSAEAWSCILSDPKHNYEWTSNHCWEKHYYICQTHLSHRSTSNPLLNTQPGYYIVTPAPAIKQKFTCPKRFKLSRNKCYHLSDDAKSWEDSFHACEEIGAQLAMFKSNSQDRKLKQSTKRKRNENSYWIGGRYDWEKNVWVWAKNGKSVNGRIETDTAKWLCTLWKPQLIDMWSSDSCFIKHRYLCQVNARREGKGRRAGRYKTKLELEFRLYNTTTVSSVKNEI